MTTPRSEKLFFPADSLQEQLTFTCPNDPSSSACLIAPEVSDWLRLALVHLPTGAVLVRGEELFLNRAAEVLTGYTHVEVPTLSLWFEKLHPGRSSQIRQLYEQERAAGFLAAVTLPLVRKDGEERIIEFVAFGDRSTEVWLLRDVGEAARLARLMEQSAKSAEVGGWELDARTMRLYWTSETYRIHELSPETYTPTLATALQFYAPESIPLITQAVDQGLREGLPFDLELQMLTALGKCIWVRAIGIPEHEEGRTVRLFGSFQNITHRRQAQEALRLSEEQIRRVVHSSPDCLLELDLSRRIVSVNPRGLEMLERANPEAVLGQDWVELWPAEMKKHLETGLEAVTRGQDARFQVFGPVGRKSLRWWDMQLTAIRDPRGRLDRILVSARDISELKQAEADREEFQRNLLQTQKLESLGVLAGGIAHDFNNLLTGILGNAELIRLSLPTASPAAEFLRQIEKSAERAADLCRQMLAYAGKGRFLVEPIDLSAVVAETVQLLQLSVVSKKANMSMFLTQGLSPILGDATQIRQVLMNLVINASEALGEAEGQIRISTGQMHVDRTLLTRAQAGSQLLEGEYVFLEVTDTGCGMDEATLARIFEPFFTTKFTGRGLGLSAVLGIVRAHKGILQVQSTPGGGSTFRLYFPPTSRPIVLPRLSHLGEVGWRGRGIVLVVDDEDPVRRIAVEMTHSFGFDTLEARDGREAIEVLQRRPEIRVMLLDLTMPRLDGEQTLKELGSLLGDVRVILMSGYSKRELSERFAGLGLAGFLQKPFTRDQIGKKLREALGE